MNRRVWFYGAASLLALLILLSAGAGAWAAFPAGDSPVQRAPDTAAPYARAPADPPAPTDQDRSPPLGALTPTPTVCPIQFSDVSQADPFYVYIRCLACRGVLEGYCDSRSRGGTTLSRGTLAQWIANAAGYTDVIPSTQQTFTDVPLGSPFWLYVERAACTG